MTQQPRYATLRDYVALLRRQRVIIVVVTAVFALAGFGLSLTQSPTYTAQANISYHDLSESLRLLGVNVVPVVSPQQLAETGAEQVTSYSVAKRVAKQLKQTNATPQQLQNAITTHISATSNLVTVQANWESAGFAAQLANAFADQGVAAIRRSQRRQIDRAIKGLEDRTGTHPGAVPATPGQIAAQQELVTLQTIKSIARPSEVAQRADAPSGPTSPKPARNTILGAVVGIAFALLAAYVRDSLDRKIRRSKDAHDELGFPILGHVAARALGSTGLASNGRAYVAPADLESFRVLRNNLAFFQSEQPVRVVLVTSGLAAEGKTTVAASLASAAAVAGQRTLLVDGDLRRPDIASRLEIKSEPGLAEYLAGTSPPQDILQSYRIGQQGNGAGRASARSATESVMVCIASGRVPAQPAELLTSERCRDFLDKVGKAYDLVVIDSSPLLSSVDPLELIPFVDLVLVCVRLSWSTREEARAIKNALGRLPDRPTGLVVTGLGDDEEEYGYYAGAYDA
jgi:succinoglycan biosynthesis transport protein ExoP